MSVVERRGDPPAAPPLPPPAAKPGAAGSPGAAPPPGAKPRLSRKNAIVIAVLGFFLLAIVAPVAIGIGSGIFAAIIAFVFGGFASAIVAIVMFALARAPGPGASEGWTDDTGSPLWSSHHATYSDPRPDEASASSGSYDSTSDAGSSSSDSGGGGGGGDSGGSSSSD